MLEQLDVPLQKTCIYINLEMDFKFFTKINPEWITDLNVKHKAFIKLLEDNMRANLDDLGYGDDFLYTTAKT